jgi:hypothetical protein
MKRVVVLLCAGIAVGSASCVNRVDSFQSLAALRFERRMDSIESSCFSHRKIVGNWPTEELQLFTKLPEHEQAKYLVFRLAVETTLDGERAYQIQSLCSAYDKNVPGILRSKLSGLPQDQLVRFCVGVGGSVNRFTSNLAECERLSKPKLD